jgi:hypothetical protein
MSRLACALVVTCLMPVAAWAVQEPAPVPPPIPAEPSPTPPAEPPASPAPDPAPPKVGAKAATEIAVDKDTQAAIGLSYGGPIGLAGSLRLLHGLGADVREGEGRVKAVCAVPIPHCAQGFLFQADAGSGGGKLSLGIGARARVEEKDFRGTMGVALRASLLRTWGSPVGTEPDLTYLGPELDLSIVRVNLTLGVLWRLSGHTGASAVFAWGFGFGL